MVNPENAELQRSELADPRADVRIAQTRQDLFLAAATQFWDWVAAVKFLEVQRRAVGVAEDRFKQVEGRAKAGAVAPLDVVEAEPGSSTPAGSRQLPPNGSSSRSS